MRISYWSSDVCSSDLRLAVFDGFAIFDEDLFDDAGFVGFDFIEQLHGFDDAQRVAFFDRLAHVDERRGAGVGRAVERAHHGRLDDMALRHGRGRSEEHTSELQSLMRISYAVFCLKKKNTKSRTSHITATNEHEYSTLI